MTGVTSPADAGLTLKSSDGLSKVVCDVNSGCDELQVNFRNCLAHYLRKN